MTTATETKYHGPANACDVAQGDAVRVRVAQYWHDGQYRSGGWKRGVVTGVRPSLNGTPLIDVLQNGGKHWTGCSVECVRPTR